MVLTTSIKRADDVTFGLAFWGFFLWTQFIFLSFTVRNAAFNAKCPDQPHRHIRAKYFCNGSKASSYSCLFNDNTNAYTESCDQPPSFVRPGQRYVLTGKLSNRECAMNRYQPFVFWSNLSSQCMFKKSKCTDIGQIVTHTDSIKDNRCRCDYTKGFAFITIPSNGCDCIALEEDCSCYQMSCPANTTISPDYKCTAKIAVNQSKCTSITYQRKNNTELSKPFYVLRKDIGLSSEYKDMGSNSECSICVAIVITVILFLPVIYWKDLPDLIIPCNWSTLSKSLNSTRLIKDLTRWGIKTKDFMSELPQEEKKRKRELLLIMITGFQKGDNAIILKRLLCNQSIQFKEILLKPILREKIPKRDVDICKQQLELKSSDLQLLERDDILDAIEFLIESLIVQPTYLNVTGGTAKQLTDGFLDKIQKSVEKGSFECLLKYLQSGTRLAKISTSLSESLPEAILCRFVRGKIYEENEEQLHVDSVLLTFEVENKEIDVVQIICESGCCCSKWFMQELGLYPDKSRTPRSFIRLIPLINDVTTRIEKSLKNGCFSELLERILCRKNVIRSLCGSKIVKVSIKYGDSSCDKLGNMREQAHEDILDNMFILKANKSFLKEEFQLTDKIHSFLEKHNLHQNLGTERTEQFGIILKNLKDKPELFDEFCNALQDIPSIQIRLEESKQLYVTDHSSFPLERILANLSALLEHEIDLVVFKEPFMDTYIFDNEYFTNIESKDQEEQILQFIFDTIQFGRKAMQLFVDVLNKSGQFTKEINDSVNDIRISADANAPLMKFSRSNSVIFEGEFCIELKQ